MNLKTKAIILRRTNYGEADRIINFLTPKGQIDGIARGVRREKSRLSGGLELLSICEITVHQRNKEQLGIITSARILKFYNNILKDYVRLNFLYDAMKTINQSSKFLEEDVWYLFLEKLLGLLDSPVVDFKIIKIWFFLEYADLMGYGLDLDSDVGGETLLSSHKYHYDSEERGLRVSNQGKVGPEHIKLVRLLKIKSGKLKITTTSAWVLDDCLDLVREHAAISGF